VGGQALRLRGSAAQPKEARRYSILLILFILSKNPCLSAVKPRLITVSGG
jgi:hypothetical protein